MLSKPNSAAIPSSRRRHNPRFYRELRVFGLRQGIHRPQNATQIRAGKRILRVRRLLGACRRRTIEVTVLQAFAAHHAAQLTQPQSPSAVVLKMRLGSTPTGVSDCPTAGSDYILVR